MTDTPAVGSIWRHADGGLYRVLENKGQVKIGKSPWFSAIKYDHCDGTQSVGPYTTDLLRFCERFTLV